MPIDNNVFQKNANTSLVARLIWQKKSISRADVARELGLYRSTVTNISSYLIEAGIIKEGKRFASTQQGGRKAVELSINSNFGCVFGFDIQPSHYRAVILSLDGTELWRETGSFGVIPIQEMMCKALNRAFEVHKKFAIPVLSVCFAVPGIVDASCSKLLTSYPFGVSDLDVRSVVQDRCCCPVYLENDANTAAWLDILRNNAWRNALSVVADFHEEARTYSNIIGIGAGFGLIIDGKVFRGSHNAAGEFKSISWKDGMNNQSGLPIDVLRSTVDDKNCLELWIEDTFRSFIPVLSIMDFDKIVFHGNPFEDKEFVLDVLSRRVPEFLNLAEKYHCEVLFDSNDECVSASGAAMMCLHNLFSVPDLKDSDMSEKLTWEKIIALSKQQRVK